MLLAKPSGVSLEDHTQHVRDEAKAILQARPFYSEKYRLLCERNLAELLDVAALWHDAGKAHSAWQNACQKDHQIYQATGKSGPNLLRSGIRHEMDSLLQAARAKAPLTRVGNVAIAAHHRKLGEKFEHRWKTDDYGKFASLWKTFKSWSADLRADDAQAFDDAIIERYKYDGPRALLQLADGRASGREDNRDSPKLLPFKYVFPHLDETTGLPTYRGVQELIQQVWDEPFTILRAPTGGGKTDACLMWAEHQIAQGRADRLVIAMPTRFTSNALSANIENNGLLNGLYHSSAWQSYTAKFYDAQLRLARELLPPVTVTTIDHLCIALTGAREDHHAIFWNMAHSCVVIDEADFYDDFTQRNILVLLRALKALRVPVLIMSATVPESARELYALSGQNTSEIHDSTEGRERVRCHLTTRGAIENPADIADLLERAIAGKPTIIYCNTVKRAQDFTNYLLDNGAYETDLVLYHSRFIEEDKIALEAKLDSMLGPKAWKEGRAYGIAVLTQIGELSVNISADLMISELCPIDRLAQRIGRLSRFRDTAGELFLIEPHRKNSKGELRFYPAPYGTFVSNRWEMTPVLEMSREKLTTGDYSAADLVRLVNEIYPSIPIPAPRARDNQDLLERLFVSTRFIIPTAQMAEDDEDFLGGQWRSRDIPPQKTIYFAEDSGIIDDTKRDLEFDTWNDWREWSQKRALTTYVYDFNRAVRNNQIQKRIVPINEDQEEIWIVDSHSYSHTRGLNFESEVKSENDEEIDHE